MKTTHGAWLAAVVVVLLAIAVLRPGSEPVSEPFSEPELAEPDWADAAQAVLKPFKQQLMAALQEGLAESPEAAIDACRLRAPAIAQSLESETLRVGRTSHRLRNPANAPKSWMQPILAEFQAATPGEIAYRVAPVAPGWVGYAEPIYVQPPCLTCHGAALSLSIQSRIQQAYPDDQATGFALGDFRGLFWVELARPPGA